MTSVKSLAARFYRLKSGHAPTGTYLKLFGHREYDKCWWLRKRNTADVGASLPPVQPVERPAVTALEGGGKGYCMESEQMQACANFGAFFHGKMRSNGDGLPGSY
jgi:hypothetical protein